MSDYEQMRAFLQTVSLLLIVLCIFVLVAWPEESDPTVDCPVCGRTRRDGHKH